MNDNTTAAIINNTMTNATITTTSTQTATNPSAQGNMQHNDTISNVSSSDAGVTTATNVVAIPVPIVHNADELYTYVCVKGSLHDRSCSVFGLNESEVQAIVKRFENSVKPLINGVMVSVPPLDMINCLAQLGYKVICSCGEAEISWTMQREI